MKKQYSCDCKINKCDGKRPANKKWKRLNSTMKACRYYVSDIWYSFSPFVKAVYILLIAVFVSYTIASC